MMTKQGWITRKKNNPKEGEKMAVRGIPDLDIVSVGEIPLTKAERRLLNIINAVYKLPRGRGVRVLDSNKYATAGYQQRYFLDVAKRLGKPVTTRVRYIGKAAYIYVFKRTDLTKRRTGLETR